LFAALGNELKDAAVVSVISENVAVLVVRGVKGGRRFSVEAVLAERNAGGCRFPVDAVLAERNAGGCRFPVDAVLAERNAGGCRLSVDAFRAERNAGGCGFPVAAFRAEGNERRAEFPRYDGRHDVDLAVRNLGDGDILPMGGTVALDDDFKDILGATVGLDDGVMTL